MRLASLLTLLLIFALQCDARRTRAWTYEELATESDAIIIAKPVEVRRTSESTSFLGVITRDQNGDEHPVIGFYVVTTLEILVVLKGELAKEHIQLRHLYRKNPPVTELNGLAMLEFDPKESRRYLLFLKQNEDEFLPTAGQTDPWFSVKDLGLSYP